MLIKGCILKTMSMSEMKIPFCDMEYHGYCNWAWALIFDASKVAQLKRKSTKTRKGHTSLHWLTIIASLCHPPNGSRCFLDKQKAKNSCEKSLLFFCGKEHSREVCKAVQLFFKTFYKRREMRALRRNLPTRVPVPTEHEVDDVSVDSEMPVVI